MKSRSDYQMRSSLIHYANLNIFVSQSIAQPCPPKIPIYNPTHPFWKFKTRHKSKIPSLPFSNKYMNVKSPITENTFVLTRCLQMSQEYSACSRITACRISQFDRPPAIYPHFHRHQFPNPTFCTFSVIGQQQDWWYRV